MSTKVYVDGFPSAPPPVQQSPWSSAQIFLGMADIQAKINAIQAREMYCSELEEHIRGVRSIFQDRLLVPLGGVGFLGPPPPPPTSQPSPLGPSVGAAHQWADAAMEATERRITELEAMRDKIQESMVQLCADLTKFGKK